MKYKKYILLPALALLTTGLHAQDGKRIAIETDHTALILNIGKNGRVYQSYLGERLADAADNNVLPQGKEAYITGGMEDQFQPAIRITHTDGNPSLELIYADKKVIHPDTGSTETIISLKDPQYPITVNLHYQAYAHEDVIKAWTEIVNGEKGTIILNDYASSMLHFDAGSYWLTQFHGDWAYEMQMQESKLTSGIKEIDSKLGTRADMYQSPMFLLSLNKLSDETSGEVMAGTLAWTGNFRFHFEQDQNNSLRVVSGINPYASAYQLAAGKTFTTPAFIFSYSAHGRGQVSRNLHAWARNYDVMDGNKSRLVLLNNWETTTFNFNEQRLDGIMDDAVKLGADLFLLDDGWFGNKYPRSNDKAGLGDWQETKTKLPNGITHLVKQADAKGTKFGIWIEPEMVNPKSELYEKHPDWIIKLPNRAENYYRNQLVLDLANPKVADFVFNTMDDLIGKHPGLAFIKWDCNRLMSNNWSPYLKDKQSNLYVDYVLNLYDVLKRLRAKYPHLPIMLCSGGGARTDYEALKYFTEFWASDDTDPLERVYIQWGYSNFFPSNTVTCHVTSWGKQSLKFRTDVAMMGKLGYDIDVSKMTPDELAFSQQAIKNYKRLSSVIWFGELYRLVSPYEANRAVLMYVDGIKAKAVLFNYNLNIREREQVNRVRLQGLDPQKKYKVEEVNMMPGAKPILADNGRTYTGDYLMKIGLDLNGWHLKALTSSVVEMTAQ
ncbi:alpha-galactosidase [Mucilaginibacter yixingensis]|uniref:Alpha-galactosidase n=1 Tax=Mucilaginibacter yixingensis TaxID=1295612 RepID=A0A2T5JAK0_9SPHI|nr:alpha-galactosidase [Mucilaginibacter yixingensis]PTQ97893.1 alpha-galactosidase [Mucilaginibacter yixingensis]